MPCQGPSPQEMELDRKYKEKLKNPKFLEEEATRIAQMEYKWKNFGKKKYEDKLKKEENSKNKIEKIVNNKIKNLTQIEDVVFNSFMAVFLCKAMNLIATNNLMQHTYVDMEWWYNEHKYRDEHNNKSKLSKEEVMKKLIEINTKYKII